ncbi:hypothetical protein IKF28_01330 [Candidatus Saccharibacteria bacterium]|nr:hypothetical protein [Candidatus Saccharibacteria bacterium]
MGNRLVTVACFGVKSGEPMAFSTNSAVVDYEKIKTALSGVVAELFNCNCDLAGDSERGIYLIRTKDRRPYGLDLFVNWFPVQEDGSLKLEDALAIPPNIGLLPEDVFFDYLNDVKEFIKGFDEEMWRSPDDPCYYN